MYLKRLKFIWKGYFKAIRNMPVSTHVEMKSIVKINRLLLIVRGLMKTGEYSKALDPLKEAKDIAFATLGDKYILTVTVLNNFSYICIQLGYFREAEKNILKAIEIRNKIYGNGHPTIVKEITQLALVFKEMGCVNKAENTLNEAYKILKNSGSENHKHMGEVLGRLGAIYDDQGRIDEATDAEEKALEIKQQTLRKRHPSIAATLNNLAILYRQQGRIDESEECLIKSLSILVKYKIKNNDNLEQIIYMIDKNKIHPDAGSILNSLGVFYRLKGLFKDANKCFELAIYVHQKKLGLWNPVTANTLSNYALYCLSQNEYDLAENYAKKALQIREKVFGLDHPDVAISIHNLASIYHGQERLDEATLAYEQALKIKEKSLGLDHPAVADTLINLSILKIVTENTSEAFPIMFRGLSIENNYISKIIGTVSDGERNKFLKQFSLTTNIFLSMVMRLFPDNITDISLIYNMIMRRKSLGREASATLRYSVLGGNYPHLQEKLDEITDLKRERVYLLGSSPELDGIDKYKENLGKLDVQINHMERTIAREIPEIGLENQYLKATISDVARRIPEQSVLLEFAHFNEYKFDAVISKGQSPWLKSHYLVLVLTGGKHDAEIIFLGEAIKIDHSIAKFRFDITGDKNELSSSRAQVKSFDNISLSKGMSPEMPNNAFVSNAGQDLRAIVFDPLKEAVAGRINIILAPDGELTRVPFDVLPQPDGTYLGDDGYHFHYLGTGRDLLRFDQSRQTQASGPSVVIADPDYGLAGENDAPARSDGVYHFLRLPGTQIEGKCIAQRLGVTNTFFGNEASKKRLNNLRSPSILHIATHGFFFPSNKPVSDLLTRNWQDRTRTNSADSTEKGFSKDSIKGFDERARHDNPLLRSGLALSGANISLSKGAFGELIGDGIITAEEVSGLDLHDTEMVVLSACETGLGEIHVGEGVLGLRRAFFIAGAKTLVMSLWKLSDLATSILMDFFYENLLKYQPRNQALQNAKTDLRKLTVEKMKQLRWLTDEYLDHCDSFSSSIKDERDYYFQCDDDFLPFQHPCYWGAFICEGDSPPLHKRNQWG